MHWLARHTMAFARPLAGRRWFRLWGIIQNVGRTSGRAYATPVVVIQTPDGFIIPVPFGPQTAWVQNVIAAGRASIRWAGQDHPVTSPAIIDLTVPGADSPFNRLERIIMRRVAIRTALHLVDSTRTR